MFFAADHRRPSAGFRFAGLALLAVLAFAGAPLAAAGHHHAGRASPGDDASCAACLWQAHHAADLAATPDPGAPDVALLAATAAGLSAPAATLPGHVARPPPAPTA